MTLVKWSWVKFCAVSMSVLALSACVEIKSDAKVTSDAKVSFTTTYDVSKIISAVQMTNKGSADEMARGLSCEKMNEQLTKEYSCKDLGLGKFAVSGNFVGETSNGVTLDTDTNRLTVDAVQLFKKVADLNPNKQANDATDAASALMQKGLVPVAADQAAQYKQIGMSLLLNLTLPSEVLTVDGVAVKDIKDNTVAVNFIDVAGKDSYLVTSKNGQNKIWWKILFVLLAIAAIAAAVLYLLKRQKAQSRKSTMPIVTNKKVDEVDAVVNDDSPSVDTPKM